MAIALNADATKSSTSARLSVGRAWLVGGIVAVGLILRLWGIDWQLPYLIHYDELKYVSPAAAGESYVDVDDEGKDYRNPWLFHHLLEIEYRVLATFSLTQLGIPPGARPEILGHQVLVARVTVALLGAAAVALMYRVGVRLFGLRTGLVAAALLAVNSLQSYLSHFAVNDVPAHFFMVATLLAAVELYRKPRPLLVFATGLLVGLSAAAKYNYGIVVLVPLAILLLHARRRASLQDLVHYSALLGLGSIAGFVIGMPEVLWSHREMLEGMRRQARGGDEAYSGQDDDPVYWLYSQALMRAFGLPALIVGVAGLVLLARRRPGLAFVLAVCPVLYMAFMLARPIFFSRFALPVVPFICLFVAYALVYSWSKVGSPPQRALLIVASCVLVLGPPVVLDGRMNELARRTDSRVEARQWVQQNIPVGSRLARQTHSIGITLEHDPLHQSYQLSFFPRLSDDQDFMKLACGGTEYVVISSYMWERQRTTSRGGEPTGYELLEHHGQLVRTFDQGPNVAHVPLNLDDTGIPFWLTERYARPGPTIKVYRLLPGVC